MNLNGRRGAFQILFGVSYGMIALGYASQQTIPPQLMWLEVYFPDLVVPPLVPTRIAAVAWGIAAGAGLVGAFLPRPQDRYSFQALTFMPTAWGLLSGLSFIADTYPNGVLALVLYLAMGGAVMIVSGMAGPHDKDLRPVTLEGEELLPPMTGPQEIIERAAAREDADGDT
jgi:hypothetical protein